MAKPEKELNIWPFDAIRFRKAQKKLMRDLDRYGSRIRQAGDQLVVIKEKQIVEDGLTYSLNLSARNSEKGRTLRIEHRKISHTQGKWNIHIIRNELEFEGGDIRAVLSGNIRLDGLNFEALASVFPKLGSIEGPGKQAAIIDRFADSVFALIDTQESGLKDVFNGQSQ